MRAVLVEIIGDTDADATIAQITDAILASPRIAVSLRKAVDHG